MLNYASIFRIVLVCSYLIGIAGISISLDKPYYFRVAALFVPLSFIILMIFHTPHSLRFWLALLFVGLFGFTVEAIGTNTGLIFGQYVYGKSLGFSVLGTPPNMAFNWMMLVYLFAYYFNAKKLNLLLKSLLASLAMVAFDWIIEPVAIRLDMWQWVQGYPPFHNYVGWFLVSLSIFLFFFKFVGKFSNPMAKTFLILQLLFFSILNLIFRLI